MGDADGATDILVFTIVFQVGHLSFSLIDVQVTIVIDHCHTGTVIAAVFQTLKSFDKNRISLFIS